MSFNDLFLAVFYANLASTGVLILLGAFFTMNNKKKSEEKYAEALSRAEEALRSLELKMNRELN